MKNKTENPIVFISSPYGHVNPVVVAQRIHHTKRYVAHLLNANVQAISPTVYGHSIVTEYAIPGDWAFWQNFCLAYLLKSKEMHILCLDGWKESIGVKGEVLACIEAGITVYFVEHNTYEKYQPLPSELNALFPA